MIWLRSRKAIAPLSHTWYDSWIHLQVVEVCYLLHEQGKITTLDSGHIGARLSAAFVTELPWDSLIMGWRACRLIAIARRSLEEEGKQRRRIGKAIHPARGDMMDSAMHSHHQGSHKAQERCRTGYNGKIWNPNQIQIYEKVFIRVILKPHRIVWNGFFIVSIACSPLKRNS